MHREFRPQDMHQADADPFVAATPEHPDQGSRRLYLFTALLGLLIGGDVLLGIAGLPDWRLPGGSSLSLVAALLGAVYIVYGALEALAHGRIGADFALAQACIAALMLGQPFVAAEVVFIALVDEVLEAVTFARTRRAVRSLVDQTPRTAGYGGMVSRWSLSALALFPPVELAPGAAGAEAGLGERSGQLESRLAVEIVAARAEAAEDSQPALAGDDLAPGAALRSVGPGALLLLKDEKVRDHPDHVTPVIGVVGLDHEETGGQKGPVDVGQEPGRDDPAMGLARIVIGLGMIKVDLGN